MNTAEFFLWRQFSLPTASAWMALSPRQQTIRSHRRCAMVLNINFGDVAASAGVTRYITQEFNFIQVIARSSYECPPSNILISKKEGQSAHHPARETTHMHVVWMFLVATLQTVHCFGCGIVLMATISNGLSKMASWYFGLTHPSAWICLVAIPPMVICWASGIVTKEETHSNGVLTLRWAQYTWQAVQ